MNELLEIINASDPEAGEDFLKLLQPEKYDRVEMGSILEATLGHDLTCYYDAKEVHDYINKIIEHPDIPDEVKEFVDQNRDELIQDSMNAFQLTRSTLLTSNIDARVEEETGYNISDFIPIDEDDEEFLLQGEYDDVIDSDPIDSSSIDEDDESDDD